MKVSIITTTYNSEKTVQRCIDSVVMQDYNNIEHLIIDGNSSDGTMKKVYQNINSISTIISEPDEGPYDAFNKGIKASTGDLIGFLHSSDYFVKNDIISKLVHMVSKKNSDSIYGDLVYVNSKKEVTRKWIAKDYNKKNFKYGWMPPHPTLFIKSNIYKRLGLFKLNFGTSADYELMLRYLYYNNISTCYLPESITAMELGGLSDSGISNRLIAHYYDWKAWSVNGNHIFPLWVILKPIRKIKQYL